MLLAYLVRVVVCCVCRRLRVVGPSWSAGLGWAGLAAVLLSAPHWLGGVRVEQRDVLTRPETGSHAHEPFVNDEPAPRGHQAEPNTTAKWHEG